MKFLAPFFAFLLLGAACTSATAQTSTPVPAAAPASTLPDWDRLTPAQRDMLVAPMRERWNASPEHRARMFEHAQRWKSMTPQQRRQARSGVARFQKMAPEDRAAAKAAYQQFRQLPEAERKAMREKLKAMTPEQRRAWLRSQPAPAERAESRLRGDRMRADEAARSH